MEIKTVRLEVPAECNIILGQSHFIKTVEDLYEVIVGEVPGAKFGLAFCEASGHCLIRSEGNAPDMVAIAQKNASEIAAGHTFIVVLKDAFPINVLNAIKMCQEVCTIYCATANPVEVIVAQTDQGRGVLGVIDGEPPKGIEDMEGVAWRKKLLRDFGYKL
jgi:adenosine/AMP kinase